MRRTSRTLTAVVVGLAATGGTVAAGAAGGTAAAGTTGTATHQAADTVVAHPRSAALGARTIELPPANGTFDYQLGGAYPPAAGVRIVDRDRTETPAAGRYNVCYVNGFQTQPGETGWWKREHPELLLRVRGRHVADANWPDELLLDVRTPAKRQALAGIVGRWIDGCAAAGFQAVEPDNLDSWTRSKGRIRRSDGLAFARLLTARAHAAGLAIGQKNATEVASGARRSLGFDFAVVEECQPYDECDAYTDEYGAQVYEIEYTDGGGASTFRAACRARGTRISVTYRDRDLVPRPAAGRASGRGRYVFRSC